MTKDEIRRKALSLGVAFGIAGFCSYLFHEQGAAFVLIGAGVSFLLAFL